MKQYYASLTGPLLGGYMPLPIREGVNLTDAKIIGGAMLNSSKLARLWCAVYSVEEVQRQIDDYGGWIIPDDRAGCIDWDEDDMTERLSGWFKDQNIWEFIKA